MLVLILKTNDIVNFIKGAYSVVLKLQAKLTKNKKMFKQKLLSFLVKNNLLASNLFPITEKQYNTTFNSLTIKLLNNKFLNSQLSVKLFE